MDGACRYTPYNILFSRAVIVKTKKKTNRLSVLLAVGNYFGISKKIKGF